MTALLAAAAGVLVAVGLLLAVVGVRRTDSPPRVRTARAGGPRRRMATSRRTRNLVASGIGLTVWAVLVPESLAYATIAGVSPVVGLYAAVPSLILYAAFGSSRHLVVGPMSATAALSAGVVAVFAPGDAAFYAALTTGVALVTVG